MRRNGLGGECGAGRLRGSGVPGDEQLDRVAAERLAAAGGEERVALPAAALVQPCPQHPGHLRGERGAAFLAALAGAPDVRAGAQARAGAASSASASPRVRKETTVLPKRAGGMARTRWIRAACSGWRRAA